MINHIISKSQSFETRIEGKITIFQSEGNLLEALSNLGFTQQQFRNSQSGKQEFGNLYYICQSDESEGIFIHHNPNNNTWFCQLLKNGNYDNFI